MKDRNNEIYTHIDRITDHLAAMSKQERIAWFRRSTYAQPLNFLWEIDGTTYAVRAFFKEDARENITDKVQRIILKSDDNNKEILSHHIKALKFTAGYGRMGSPINSIISGCGKESYDKTTG